MSNSYGVACVSATFLALALALLACAHAAPIAESAAVFDTGNSLYEYLTANNATARAHAAGYIAGVADVGSMGKVFGWSFCLPQRTTKDQITDVVKQWLDQHPEKRYVGAVGLVSEALAGAFPCR
jgi:hypothetical protein